MMVPGKPFSIQILAAKVSRQIQLPPTDYVALATNRNLKTKSPY